MLQVNWPVVDTIQPLSNKLATGVKIKATGELKFNDSPTWYKVSKYCYVCDNYILKGPHLVVKVMTTLFRYIVNILISMMPKHTLFS